MPVNNYSVGRDVVIDIQTPTGPLRISKITGFTSRAVYNEREVNGMDGVTDNLSLPKCWEGTLNIERQGPQVDAYFAEQEAAYYAGQNLANAMITETITEPNGGVSQYRHTNVQLMLSNAGEWRGDETVKIEVSWKASRRIRVS